ncbi:hypothetical protein HY992_00495 [Candidatus Micrarchaeota archaeon]|nr:hypothetical protein [Candidatus Micrarchaeota archaeon]
MRREVVKRVRELRRSFASIKPMVHDPRAPAFVETAQAIVKGKASERQLVALRTPHCTHGKCTMCGFKSQGVEKTSFEDLKAQFDGIKLIETGRVSLCSESSLFHLKVPFSFLEFAFRKLAGTRVQEIDLETCAADVVRNIGNIERLNALLRKSQQLFVGMGLESQDDFVRSVLIGKKLLKKLFEKAIGLLASAGVGAFAYVILKSPGLEEKEAVEECVRTIEYFFSVARRTGIKHARATLKPLFIPRGTIVEKLFEEGLVAPPKLWAVIEVLKRIHQLGNVFAPLTDEGLAEGRIAENCAKCTGKVKEAIRTFNATQDIKPLQKLSCECKEEWKNED